MRFMGSKRRIAPELSIILHKHMRDTYIEPFVGGCNMMEHIKCPRRFGSDVNPALIAMWQGLQKGWVPPSTLSEEEYEAIKTFPGMYNPALVGFVGFGCSFGGKWFGGFARSKERDHTAESKLSVLRQRDILYDVTFSCRPYSIIDVRDALIYCDPPYENTTKYNLNYFDYTVFWNWCRRLSKHNTVLISSYEAPDDFKSIWHKTIRCDLTVNINNKCNTERLFIHDTCLL